jgi:DNA-binding CsgD family transcriptional regulator
MGSIAENMAGEHAAARRLIGAAEAAARAAAHYPPGAVAVLQARALNGFFENDLAAARAAAAEGARLASETGDRYAQGIMLLNLGSAALNAGDLAGARPLLAAALRLAHQIDDRVAQFYLLDAFGCHAALSGQPRRAAQLLGAAETVRAEAGANLMPFLVPLLARSREAAIAALGPAKFQAGFEAGQRLDRDGGLRLALGEPAREGGAPGGAAEPGEAPGPLAKREADVARLVAGGLTNKQIGARLFISERTVDSHVRSILNKLGVGSRAQIAAWMATLDR